MDYINFYFHDFSDSFIILSFLEILIDLLQKFISVANNFRFYCSLSWILHIVYIYNALLRIFIDQRIECV